MRTGLKSTFLLRITLALIVCCFFSPRSSVAQSQSITLRGFVTDSENAEPLYGANILLKNINNPDQTRGAVANANGYYVISELDQGSYAIRISFVGYQILNDTLRLTAEDEQYTYSVGLSVSEQKMDEVVVTGKAGGATTLKGGRQNVDPVDLSRVSTPSVSGDLANYLQTLPSVVSVGDRGGELFIRGGSPDQNLVLMDKMQIYRPFHIVGFYSAFPQDLISSAQVYAGGYPAKYSGRLSSVIDVSMRGGNKEQFEGAATIGPFLSGLRVEGPLNDQGLSFLASGRFSQIERTAPVFLGEEQPIKFGDQFVKLQNATETGRCSITGLRTYDRGKIDPDRNSVFQWSNYGFGGRCVAFAEGSSSLIDISLNTTYSQNSVGTGDEPEREASIWNLSSNIDLAVPLKGSNGISGGLQARIDKPIYNMGEKFQAVSSGEEFLVGFKGYLSLDLGLGSNIDVSPGIALSSVFEYGMNLEPRLRATWRPFGNEAQELNAAFGIYHQTIVGVSDERDLGSAFTAWMPVPLGEDRPRSWHGIMGWRQQLGSFGLTVEGYHKNINNLAVPAWSTIARFTTDLVPAEGTIWGVDLRGEFSQGPVYGYIGYGYSWTKYLASQENFGNWFGTDIQSYHPAHDQRHSLNALLSTEFSFATLDIRWQLGSGMPYTRPFGFDSQIHLRDLQDPRRGYGTTRLLYEKPYQGRLPAYHRLDVSMKHTFELEFGNLTLKGGAINSYDRQNLFYFDLFTLRRVDQLPLIPFVAMEIATK